jgi:hypothetical protein
MASKVFNALATTGGVLAMIIGVLPVAKLAESTCSAYSCSSGDGDAMENYYYYAFNSSSDYKVTLAAVAFVFILIGTLIAFFCFFGDRDSRDGLEDWTRDRPGFLRRGFHHWLFRDLFLYSNGHEGP